MLRDFVKTNPLALLLLNKQEEINFVNEFLPYSTGFEIECERAKSYKLEYFKDIPLIMDTDSWSEEQRFRIPNGINGILCLYFISLQARKHLTLNAGSGIHYHVDCTDIYSDLSPILEQNKESILKELDTWPDAQYSRGLGSWFKRNDLGTTEFRVGEMTFDYKIWIERIIHCNHIVRRIKESLGVNKRLFESFYKDAFISYLKDYNQLLTKEEIDIIKKAQNPHKLVNNRIIKI
jgi:hypothetical protein